MRYVLRFDEIDEAQRALVGGKAGPLAELSRMEGVRVPPGFCVTTDAFRRVITEAPSSIGVLLDRLSGLEPDDRRAIRELSSEARRIIEETAVPDDVAGAIGDTLDRLGNDAAYAIRSSATAEDLPAASFAGQHDTYLNIRGRTAILEHVRRCWSSLFTERAVTYRLRNGVDHRNAQMAVVVQRMVFPQAAGVLFTADPATGNRRVAAVEATLGLGEALVSGRVRPDTYKVRDGAVVSRTIAPKEIARPASHSGGTEPVAVEPDPRTEPALTDAQIVRLAQLGRRIEAHFGGPQDIEWCLVDDDVWIVQSRPITTLFPIPEVDEDGNHVFISVGHQQMMTDPIKPLGLSFWKLTSPAPMRDAGGRLFVDVTQRLASPASRDVLLAAAGGSDPLIGDALRKIVDRGDVLPSASDDAPAAVPPGGPVDDADLDPAMVPDLIARFEASTAGLKDEIRDRAGPELLDLILADLHELRRLLFDPQSHQALMAGMEATWWLNDRLEQWLGEKNAADVLARSVPHNVTAQMGLALMDVADRIRPHPEVVACLEKATDDGWIDELPRLAGGDEARDAILTFLDTYGVRCVGEIDITRPRWIERPSALLPTILSLVRSSEPGAGRERFERGRQEAVRKRHELLERLRALPDGERKATETARMIDRLRAFTGYREYPKFGMVSRYFVYKQALLAEARRLTEAGALDDPEDIFFLTVEEIRHVTRTGQADRDVIGRRREAFASYHLLTPPRVITSDGEIITGSYGRDDAPAGSLVGLAVSGGTVEGRARVVTSIEDADLEAGDVLVTAFTDPSWTPAFVAAAGLVTEVGGLMTHGAVIAREYGIPAVVGVEEATRKIRDGQRIRVNGTDGYVTMLTSDGR